MLEYINPTTSVALIGMVIAMTLLILRFYEEEKSFFKHVFKKHDSEE